MEKSYLITLKEEELEQMVLRCIRQAVKELLLDIQPANRPKIGNIALACEITGLAKATIYGLTSRREIPHKKLGGRLYFEESELIEWINSFQRKTAAELNQEAEQQIKERLKRCSRKNSR